jgi:peptide/nickel transport system ATP-binding protein
VPRFDVSSTKQPLPFIPGHIPRASELPSGCVFAPRCEFAEQPCRTSRPHLRQVAPDRWTACRRWDVLPSWERSGVDAFTATGAQSSIRDGDRLIDAVDITKHYPAAEGGLRLGRRDRRVVHALDATSLWIGRGQTLGVVGESGSGKTTLARTIIGLAPATSGTVSLDGQVLPPTLSKRGRALLKRMQMVFQNPDATLNPHRSVGAAIARPMRLLKGVRGAELRRQSIELLKAVHLPATYYDRKPGELSQGERQRVAIARAFAADPDLVLCDEPISSLDVSVQGALMNLLLGLQAERGTSYLFISHDLSAVQHLSDVIAVVYLGHMMEWGAATRVLTPPFHPYTEALLSAIPVADPDVQQANIRLEGSVPTPINVPSGCRFHPRCPRCLGEICSTEEPPWQEGEGGHWIYCHIPRDTLREFEAHTIEIKRPREGA